jgi:type II secretory pathway component GspD/PulD (secretin)
VDRGIPILKDIPLLGWLFKTRSKVREKSNLVIFVSATVLNPEKINRDTRRELAEIEAHRERERLSGGPFPAPKSENSAPEDGGADSQEK